MTRVFADHAHNAFALNDLALAAHFFDRSVNLHCSSPVRRPLVVGTGTSLKSANTGKARNSIRFSQKNKTSRCSFYTKRRSAPSQKPQYWVGLCHLTLHCASSARKPEIQIFLGFSRVHGLHSGWDAARLTQVVAATNSGNQRPEPKPLKLVFLSKFSYWCDIM